MEPVEAEMKFGRQPEPVKVTFEGDQRDIDVYMNKLMRFVEHGSFDNVVRLNNQITIYPRAVND